MLASSMSLSTILILVWAAVIALSLLIEFLTYDLVTIFFVPAALVCLILAAVSVLWWVHIIVFVVLSVALVFTLRPVAKRYLIKPTIATTVTETERGKRYRLLEDTLDGNSTIRVNGVDWIARIEGGLNLEKDSVVEIVGSLSNVFLVAPVTENQVPGTKKSTQSPEPDEIYIKPAPTEEIYDRKKSPKKKREEEGREEAGVK